MNLVGPMHLAALAATRRSTPPGGGHFVFIGSMSAKVRAGGGGDVYVAAKTRPDAASPTRSARGVSSLNINACLIEPGLVWTDMTSEGNPNPDDKVAKGEMLMPDDVARAVLFVLSQPPRVCLPVVQVRPRMQLI